MKKYNDVINTFDVYKCNTTDDIFDLFKIEIEKAKTKTKLIDVCQDFQFFWWHERKINTINQYLMRARKIVNESNIKYKNYVLGFLRLGQRASICLRSAKEDKAIQKLDNKDDVLDIDINTIENLRNIIDNNNFTVTTSQKLEDVKSHLMAIYLALTTGRRFIEIYKTVSLEDGYFQNIAKQRANNKEVKAIILTDTKTVNNYLVYIREHIKVSKMSNERVTARYNKIANDTIKRVLNLDLKMHDLRAIYAELTYQEYGKNKDKEKYFAEILGHNFKMNSTKHYLKY